MASQVLIPNNKPYLTGNEIKYLQEIFQGRCVESGGKYSKMCQAWLKDLLHGSPTLLVSSGTAALEMASILCNLQPGDEVIMPSYTFVSTASAVVRCNAVPVFVDNRADTMNIDETKIEAAITPKTKAIFVVHYAGIACEMDTIMDIARRHNLLVVEDNAHGIQSHYKGKPLGSIGDIGCFSFHYTKNLIAGEGGAVSINHGNQDLIARAHIVWEKGTNRFEFLNGKVDKYAWVDLGSSFMPSEIQSACLWAQFEESASINASRSHIFRRYEQLLQPLAAQGKLKTPTLPEGCDANGHIFYIILNDASTRAALQQFLKDRQVQAFSHYVPLHSSTGGMKYGRVHGDLSVTDEYSGRLMRLPIWVGLGEEELARVTGGIFEYFAQQQ